MSPTDIKRQKRLEQVRGLLAKADSTDFPEEAATFRAHAEKMMNMYLIETWEVSADDPIGRPDPEVREFDMSWWTRRNSFYQDQWSLMLGVARHCRCVCIYWDWTPGMMKVAGLPADLDYFDLLFTQLMVEMAKRLEPKPDPTGELGHEVFKLRQAGVDWMRITKLCYQVGLVELTKGEREKFERQRYVGDEPTWDRLAGWHPSITESIKNRLANANRRYVKQQGLQGQRNYINPKVYQRGFAEGFVQEINYRMRL